MMTKMFFKCGVVVFFMCGLAGAAPDSTLRLAVVNMDQLMQAYPETKESEGLLAQQISDLEKDRDEMLQKLEVMNKDFEAVQSAMENPGLSDQGRKKKRAEAEEKFIAMRDYEKEVRQTLQSRQKQISDRKRRMRDRIVEALQDKINAYAVEKGLTLVLDAGPVLDTYSVVVYHAAPLDITEEMIRRIGGTAPVLKGAAPAVKDAGIKPAPVKRLLQDKNDVQIVVPSMSGQQ